MRSTVRPSLKEWDGRLFRSADHAWFWLKKGWASKRSHKVPVGRDMWCVDTRLSGRPATSPLAPARPSDRDIMAPASAALCIAKNHLAVTIPGFVVAGRRSGSFVGVAPRVHYCFALSMRSDGASVFLPRRHN